MSQRTMLEFNHDFCPTDDTAKEFAASLVRYMRSGDAQWLPDGVTFFGMRHHSSPCPLGDPPLGWHNDKRSDR